MVDEPGSDLLQALSAYLPEDRLLELAGHISIPGTSQGTVLFADVAGFTGLTTRLAEMFGPRRGAEEVPVYLNRLYEALIGQVKVHAGSVIGFAGDAISCWFPGDDGHAAVACALAMQAAMAPFAALRLVGAPEPTTIALNLKIAVSGGHVKRFEVGDPRVQRLDLIAGEPVAELEALNNAVHQGQVMVSAAVAAAVGDMVELEDAGGDGTTSAVPAGASLVARARDGYSPGPAASRRPAAAVDVAGLGCWLLPTVQRRLEAGGGDFLTELRPVAALFLSFDGIDFGADDGAGAKLDRLVCRAQRVATELGGNVLQLSSGDKGTYLYAAFGAPVSHEDDVSRCAAAALDLRDALLQMEFVTELKIGLGYGTARTGAYGSASRRTYGALGEGTNMAARMMSAASHAHIYVSAGFARALGGGFELAQLGGLKIKGRAAPVTAFELRGRLADDGRQLEADDSGPLVGRAAELATIAAGLERAASGQGAVIQLVAEAGMGKSELLKQALRGVPGLEVVTGACQAFGRTAPYQLWKGVFRQLLDLGPESDVAARVAAVTGALAEVDPGLAAQADLLAPVLDLPVREGERLAAQDAEERSAARRALLLRLFRHRARQAAGRGRTLVLVLEDLHWLDPASAELLAALGRAVVGAAAAGAPNPTAPGASASAVPVLLLTAARPLDADARLEETDARLVEADARLPDARRDEADAQPPDAPQQTETEPDRAPGAITLTLGPLDETAAREMVAARLAAASELAALDDGLVALLIERSGGNPFYLGELLTYLRQRVQERAAAEPGPAYPRDGQARGPQAGADDLLSGLLSDLPTSLHSLILGRLDRLEHEQLLCLKVASVVGRQFRTAWVSAAEGRADERATERAFAATEQAGLTQRVRRDPPTHAFNNAITREVTYESQSRATRALLHTRLARFVEERVVTPAEPHLDLLAFHYAQGEDAGKARHYLGAAGGAAKDAYANQAALDYFGQLLALQEGAERLPTLLDLGEVMTFVGAYAAAEVRLDEAAALAATAGDPLRRATALRLLGELHERQGDHGRARAQLEAAAALCRQEGANAELTRVLLALGGNVLWHLGFYDEAGALLNEAVGLARAAGDTRAAARALHGTANLHLYRGEAAEAEAAFSESLAMRRAARDDYGVANSLNNLAILAANAGNGVRAEELFAESLEIRQRLGDVAGVAVALNNLGYMVAQRGDLTAARRLYEDSLASRRELGDRLGQAVSLNNLAGLVMRQGALEEARALYRESVGLAASIDNAREAAAALAGLANAAPQESAARMVLVAELLLARLGAAVDPEVSQALDAARARAPRALLPVELEGAALGPLVDWALAER